jgi:hypothetical protein
MQLKGYDKMDFNGHISTPSAMLGKFIQAIGQSQHHVILGLDPPRWGMGQGRAPRV